MKKIILYTFAGLFLFSSCKEDKPNTSQSVITIGENRDTPFDRFITREFESPYNINFLYRYTDIESDMNYTLTPADYRNSVRMANLVKYLCLDAYANVTPNDFLKKYFPKMIMLVGSPAYNTGGTMVLGTAEGGLKITLYNINSLNTNNIEQLYEYYFRTIYHEFSHILHQTVDIPKEYQKITATSYVGDAWNDVTKPQALQKGYISPYSMKNHYEDFVELIAYYITSTPTQWTGFMTAAGTTGGPILQRKTDMMKTYIREVWKFEIDDLRNEILTRANSLSTIDLDNIN